MLDIREIFGPSGPFAKALSSYEQREEQVRMAEAIQEACRTKQNLMVEAGTGVGKSFAYLVPLIEWAVTHEKRVIISTNTKTLQHQLIDKDLPLLARLLGIEFKFALCVGSENYVCHRRLDNRAKSPGDTLLESPGTLKKLVTWGAETETGLRSELPFPVTQALWREVARIPDLCMGQYSPFVKKCRYQEARRSWQSAQILVVNHHLFFSNLSANGNVLPEYDAVLFDEAHNVESIAATHLGARASRYAWDGALRSIHGQGGRAGVIEKAAGVPIGLLDEIEQRVGELLREGEDLFDAIAEKFGREVDRQRYRNPFPGIEAPVGKMNTLIAALEKAANEVFEMEQKIEVGSAAERLKGVRDSLQTVLEVRDAEAVYWAERRSPPHDSPRSSKGDVVLNMAPLDISEAMDEQVYSRSAPVIAVSATLTVGGDFSYMQRCLGLRKARTLLLDSPFDYQQNVLLLTDPKAPEPTARGEAGKPSPFARHITDRVGEIVPALTGGAFVLFTSYRLMNEVYDLTLEAYQRDWRKKVPLFDRGKIMFMKQGDDSRERLLQSFRDSGRAILFATKTFWEGVDVPGDALQCVILTRLPFAVPDEPIIEAKVERIKREGGNPFFDFQVPEAAMQFRQGFGRLIRKASDIGVVAVLDSRIVTKGYGKTFLASVPQCTVSSNPEHVGIFMKKALEVRDERKMSEV